MEGKQGGGFSESPTSSESGKSAPRMLNLDLTLFYCKLLATLENALFAFPPINRTVPITRTRITASITAYSAMS
jgi:hypothetical protein